jgi:hypothetical protein
MLLTQKLNFELPFTRLFVWTQELHVATNMTQK